MKDGRFVQMGQADQIIDPADYAIIDVSARTCQDSRLGIFSRDLVRRRQVPQLDVVVIGRSELLRVDRDDHLEVLLGAAWPVEGL